MTRISHWGWGLAILLQMPQANATAVNAPYSLPPSKVYLEGCQQKALQLHQGRIEKQMLFHRQNRFLVQYAIQAADETLSTVLCDLEIGELLEQNLFNEQN